MKHLILSLIFVLTAFFLIITETAFGATVVPNRFEQTDANLAFAGAWSSSGAHLHSGGSARYSATRGSKVSIAFSGTAIHLIGTRTAMSGTAKISLDGAPPETVSFYGASTLFQQVCYSKKQLADGQHTLTIVVADGGMIHVDALDVVGALVPAGHANSGLIVAIGDSLTTGHGSTNPTTDSWPAVLSEVSDISVINVGVGGNTTAEMRARFDRDVVAHSPDAVIILGGIHDRLQGITREATQANIDWMVNRTIQSGSRPYVGTLTPCALKEHVAIMNSWIRGYPSRAADVGVVDFHRALESPSGSGTSIYLVDMVHFNSAGNELMALEASYQFTSPASVVRIFVSSDQ